MKAERVGHTVQFWLKHDDDACCSHSLASLDYDEAYKLFIDLRELLKDIGQEKIRLANERINREGA